MYFKFFIYKEVKIYNFCNAEQSIQPTDQNTNIKITLVTFLDHNGRVPTMELRRF